MSAFTAESQSTSPAASPAAAPLPATPDDVRRAFATARAAQRAWAARPVKERAAVAQRFSKLLLARRSEALDLIQRETGKNRASAMEEFTDAVLYAAHVARTAPGVLRDQRRSGAFPVLTHTVEHRVSKGVVGIITPWNYPLTLPAGDAIPALVAGNTVVLKPDSLTPDTADFVLALLRQAGLPDDVMRVVHGPGKILGEVMVENADFMMFTGSTRVGRILAEQCARRLIGLSAELGGKNPMLVLEDADVRRAAAGAVNAVFSNSGQLCVSIERIYVHTAVWDEFLAAFLKRVNRMKLIPGTDWAADMGSLISSEHLATVAAHVEDAVAKGARVLAGGRARPDLGPTVYEPTVLTDVVVGMKVYDQETFGPVVSLYRVGSEAEAIHAANDTSYGLNASVWSRRRGPEVARQLQAGTVNINEGYSAAWASYGAPMGGMKESGIGRRHGAEGILKYTEAQTIATQRVVPTSGPTWLSHKQWGAALTVAAGVLRKIR